MHVQWRGRVWTTDRIRGVVARCVAAIRRWRAQRVALLWAAEIGHDLKTLKAFGLTILESVLVRADQVIEQ
jgi:hypothetical protein